MATVWDTWVWPDVGRFSLHAKQMCGQTLAEVLGAFTLVGHLSVSVFVSLYFS